MKDTVSWVFMIFLYFFYDMHSQNWQKADVSISRLCFSLSSYLYFLVTKKSLRLQVSKFITFYYFGFCSQKWNVKMMKYVLLCIPLGFTWCYCFCIPTAYTGFACYFPWYPNNCTWKSCGGKIFVAQQGLQNDLMIFI